MSSQRKPISGSGEFVIAAAMLALFMAATQVSCGGENQPAQKPIWTVFVYGHADSNLSDSLYNVINAMSSAKLSADVRVIVYADWNASQPSPTGGNYPAGTFWKQIVGNDKPVKELPSESEQNLDDPDVLKKAIIKAFKENPAQRYGLILWDHGGQWWGGYGGDSQNGTVENPAGYTIAGLAPAIRAGLDGAGLTGSRPLDFFAFDTCLLGGAEPAYEFRDFGKVYIGNAELDFGASLNYKDTLTWLSENPNASITDFAKKENEYWDVLHKEMGFDDVLLRSHIDLDPSAMENLAKDTASLVDAIILSPTAATSIASALYGSTPVYYINATGTLDYATIGDFGQFLDFASADTTLQGDISTRAKAVKTRLTDMTIAKTQGAMRFFSQSAFNIAAPPINLVSGDDFKNYSTKAGAWPEASKWKQLLNYLDTNKGTTPPDATIELISSNPARFSIVSANNAIGNNVVKIFREDKNAPNNYVAYGLVSAGRLSPDKKVQIEWDGNLMTVGTPAQPASVAPYAMHPNEDPAQKPGLLAILGKVGSFTAGDKPQYASLIIMPDDTKAVAIQTLSIASIEDFLKNNPGAKFAPSITSFNTVTGKTEVKDGEPVTIPSDGIPVGKTKAEAGNYLFINDVQDVWSNEQSFTIKFTY